MRVSIRKQLQKWMDKIDSSLLSSSTKHGSINTENRQEKNPQSHIKCDYCFLAVLHTFPFQQKSFVDFWGIIPAHVMCNFERRLIPGVCSPQKKCWLHLGCHVTSARPIRFSVLGCWLCSGHHVKCGLCLMTLNHPCGPCFLLLLIHFSLSKPNLCQFPSFY